MTHEQDIPRTHERKYCKNVAPDGRVCALYADHKSDKHVENHGKSSWPVVK